jgi:hypothetical protein
MTTVVRGLAKLVAVVLVAGAVGGGLGIVLSKLSGNSGDSAAAPQASTATKPATQHTTTSARSDGHTTPAAPAPSGGVSVHIVDAILHPAESASGRRRHRARLTVRVQVTNRGTSVVTPARPTLFSGSVQTQTDPNADGPGTRLGALQPGKAVAVTLRFETAGSVTTQLQSQRRARVLVAGRTRETAVTVGNPATPTG